MTQRLRPAKASFGVNAGVLSRDWFLVWFNGIGLGENLQETPLFNGKNTMGFL